MTGLQFQVVPVAFTQGQDTRTQQKLVVPGKWLSLINYTLSSDNTPRRRDGSAALVSGATGNGLFTRGPELLTITGPSVASYSPGASAMEPITGTPGYVGITKTEIQRNTGLQDMPDVASNGTFTCYAWRFLSPANVVQGIAMTLVDESSGTQIVQNLTIKASASVDAVRVVAVGDAFLVLYHESATHKYFGRVILFSAPSVVGAEQTILTDANAGTVIPLEACAFSTPGQALLVWSYADGTTSVQAIMIQHLGGYSISVWSGPTNVVDNTSLTIAGLTGVTCCAYGNGTQAGIFATGNAGTKSGLVGAVADANLVISHLTRLSTTTSAHTTPNHLCAVAESGASIRVFRDFVSETGFNSLTNILEQQVDTTMGTVLPSTAVIPSAGFTGATCAGATGPFIWGKPFISGGRIFLTVATWCYGTSVTATTANPRSSLSQDAFFVVDCGRANLGFFDAAAVCGRALYGTANQASFNGSSPPIFVCSTPLISGTTFATLSTELTLLVVNNVQNLSPTGLVRLTLKPNASIPLSRCELGESAYLAGGQLSMYDGQSVAEQCFPLFPDGIGGVPGGGGTGAMTDGVHQVVAVYSWIDNAGQRHLSAPSTPISVTVASGANTGSITVTIPTLLFSQKTGVEVLVYCTVASGLTFFRAVLNNAAWAPVLNTTAATTVTFKITESDAALGFNETLYTQPNLNPTPLPSFAPPPCSYVWPGHNRLWFDKTDKPGWFGFSQEYVNNVGLQFNDSLEDNLPPASGGFVAGATMDEKIIILGSKRIYVKVGTGPQPSGAFNNYTRAEDIQSDVGCSDPLSVLPMSKGIIFKSQSGFHLLGRDLSVNYIGEGVKQFDSYTVVSAVLMADRQECRFEMRAPDGNSGVVLFFSYLIGQWSWGHRGNGTTPSTSIGATDAVWWSTGGLYAFLTAQAPAGLFKDVPLFDATGTPTNANPDDFVGSGSEARVVTSAQTSYLSIPGLESFKRVRRVYLTATTSQTFGTTNSLFVIAMTFDDSVTKGLDTATVNPFAQTGPIIDIRHKLSNQKCKSVSFQFLEVGLANNAVVLGGIQAIALEIGTKKGVNKLPAGQTV